MGIKEYPHCYHINFAQEMETCCWCSHVRKLKFGQGYFDLDIGMTTPLLSIWWWRYNARMYGMYQRVKECGRSAGAHGPYALRCTFAVEYVDKEPCPARK